MEEVEVEGGVRRFYFFWFWGRKFETGGEGGGEEEEEDGGGSGEVQKQIPMEKHNSKFHTPDKYINIPSISFHFTLNNQTKIEKVAQQ